MKQPQAAVIQMTSSSDVKQNLDVASKLIKQASEEGAALVVLPEMFPIINTDNTQRVCIAENYGSGLIQDFLSSEAKKNHIWIVAGTLPIKTEDSHRVRAACIVYDHHGKQIARYDKIHMFDVLIGESEEYQESATIEPGDADHLVVIETPIGNLGLAVCYDLRFPTLFQSLMNMGAEIIAVPSAFTVKTGTAHWDILTRARSIETLCYGLFACQTGTHASGRKTYGHSMITNPWGEVLGLLEEGTGIVTAQIDLNILHSMRKNLPIKEHQRIFKTN